ncbi:MAG TPA: fibronectin type III domain-containing protein [Pyrinomonadaceae bacterium]|nr:fibronectin type III domain-containing protein [Pyrinomonadaceae bacterium]
MNYRYIPDAALADFAENVLTLLGGTELTAIPAATRTALGTALGTLPTELGTQTATAQVAEAGRKSAVSTKNGTRSTVLAVLSQVRDNLKAGLAPKEQYDLCGFDFAEGRRGSYVALDPNDLSAFGYSNGTNKLVFKGNNRAGAVKYEIWRRSGDDGQWHFHGSTGKQSFTDSPVTPGRHYEYKVRAVAAKSVSSFSNTAIVYGT